MLENQLYHRTERQEVKPKSFYENAKKYMQDHAYSTCGMAAGAISSAMGAASNSPEAVMGGLGMCTLILLVHYIEQPRK